MENTMKKTGGKVKSVWNRLSITKKVIAIIFSFLVIVPLSINGLLQFSNWLFQITHWNTSAFGLGNSEWLNFWGSYFGGITTVIAVWWTVSQTERHYIQTNQEQKDQRRLDVLPLILLQPRNTRQTSQATLLMGNLQEKKEEGQINVDELKPIFEEFDITEITVLFGSQFEVRPGDLSDEEMRMVKNKGHEDYKIGNVKYLMVPNTTFLRPFWFINVGRGRAINLIVILESSTGHELSRLKTVFSMKPNDQIKLNFLVNVKDKDKEKVFGEFKLLINYRDIFLNQYNQAFPISIDTQCWNIGLDVNHL
jgi:hypothetical protein